MYFSLGEFADSPVCLDDEPVTVGVALSERVDVACDVRAHPTDLSFHWRFNGSKGKEGGEDVVDGVAHSPDNNDNDGDVFLDLTGFKANGTRSMLTFSPSSPRDYGTILCFANNEIGRQRKACVFRIVPAGKPLKNET